MAEFIHRCGDQYRLWSTHSDRYTTKPMTAAALTAHLLDEAVAREKAEIAARFQRADQWGTSQVGLGTERDATTWDAEACAHCGRYHHEFKAGSGAAGACRTCDGLASEPQHGPACKAVA